VSQVATLPGRYSKSNAFGGDHYEVVVEVPDASGTGTSKIRTFWEVHPSGGTKFLTAYPLDSEEAT
jgi:hypothetical protein